jgi:hypothetical protein
VLGLVCEIAGECLIICLKQFAQGIWGEVSPSFEKKPGRIEGGLVFAEPAVEAIRAGVETRRSSSPRRV